MKVAISAIRTKNIRLNRHELITSLQELGHEVIYIGQESNDKIHPDYQKYNVQFKSISIGRSNTNPIKELKSIKQLINVLKENKVEALIAYGIRTFPTVVIAARLARVKKVLCIVNGSGRLFQLKGIKGLLVKSISYPMLWLAFLMCSNIFFQNPDDMKMIKRKGLLWKKNYKVVNGSGVNVEEYPVCDLEKRPVFSMISRLTGSKGVNEYVQAAKQVKKIYPTSTFYLIGPMDDNERTINMDVLQKAVEDETIILTEKVEDVRPYLRKSRFFVLPSYYPEGVPRSILEAMAMGRPIITTDTSGCRETVENEKNGFLIPPRDFLALKEKMLWMIEHPKETEEMGIESRKLAEEKFDVHKVNSIIIEALN